MRFYVPVVAATVCGLSVAVVSAEETAVPAVAEDDDDDDTDWSQYEMPVEDEGDFDDFPEPAEERKEDTTLAEAVDMHMDENQRQMRMAICIGIVRQKYADEKADMMKNIEALAKMQGVSEEEMSNMIHMNMIKNCYLNLDQEADIGLLSDPESFASVSTKIVSPPANEPEGTASTLLSRQWELIRTFLDKEKEQGGPGKAKPEITAPKIEILGSGMNGFQKFLYFVSVFGAIFGGGYLLVKKMVGLETAKKQPKVKKTKKHN